jgi:CheY-like chemotaxis protein
VGPRDPELADLAHDLSQLLWAIQGRAHALASRLAAPDAEVAEGIAGHAARAADLLAHALAADATAPGASCDPVTVLEGAWRQAVDRAEGRSGPVAARLEGPESSPPVAIPAAALHRILANLLANAMDAAGPRVRVACTVAAHGDDVRLTLADDGPGVPASVRRRLFERGVTGDAEAGHGVGLASARDLARRAGGDLVLAPSTAGAVFELTLPAATDHPAGDVPPPPETSGGRWRVLVVDDEAAVRDMLQDVLSAAGHGVATAADADAAVAQLEAGRYDAVLVDLGLAALSGVDLARKVRDHDPHLAVIMISGWGREEELAALDPDLVDLTATKPVDPARLEELLGRAAHITAGRRDGAAPRE